MGKYDDASDEELLEWAVEGEWAFHAFYNRHKPHLLRFLSRELGDQDAAEYVLQDVMIAVREGAKTFEGRAKFSTWMWQVTKNKVAEYIRSHSRNVRRMAGEKALSNFPDPGEGPEGELRQKNLEARIYQALKTLSPEHRRVICLTFFFKIPYQAIALVEDVPLGTVKTRMLHARRKLGDTLSKLGCNEANS